MNKSVPSLTIITINYNNLAGLKKTFESVFHQTFQDFEYVVIDGGSTDGSKELIEQYQDKIDYWVSEPDKGIYNAMNKGIKAASGEYVYFLNSGDTFCQDDTLSSVIEGMKKPLDFYYGDLKFSNSDDVIYCPDTLSFDYFYKMTLPHQAVFIRKDLFDTVFYYNESLKIVSDWEFFICAICKYDASYKHLNVFIANYDLNGFSSNPENRELYLSERKACLNKHFRYFIDDHKELLMLKNYAQRTRFQALIELENSVFASKLNSFFLAVFLKLFRRKNWKDLRQSKIYQ
jgi:glycosyltransferase involved in cell wall biosynthesis